MDYGSLSRDILTWPFLTPKLSFVALGTIRGTTCLTHVEISLENEPFDTFPGEK